MSRFSLSGGVVSIAVVLLCSVFAVGGMAHGGEGGLTFEQVAALKSVRDVEMSPDGSVIAYTLTVPRRPGVDADGSAWAELHVVSVADGVDRVYVGGEVKVSDIRFTPDGKLITYLAKRGHDKHTALWAIPLSGGESRRLLTFDSSIADYRVSPDGDRVVFVAKEPECEKRKQAEEKGYKQEVFEEDWRQSKVWIAPLAAFQPAATNPSATDTEPDDPKALSLDGSAFHARFSPDGALLAVDLAPSPLVDDRYMFRQVNIVDAATGEVRTVIENPGKLGDFDFSPDGQRVAMISAADPNDPGPGRLMVASVGSGELRDVLPDLEAHISSFAWRDSDSLVFISNEGVETRLGEVDIDADRSKTYVVSGAVAGGARVPIMAGLSLSGDGLRAAVTGDTPEHPDEVFAIALGTAGAQRLTDSNPWLAEVELNPQEVIRHEARDGLELEGILIRPAGVTSPLPLIMAVHGGPEGHRSNGWLTGYSSPGQLAASRGYAVFYPNYRGSTGRGVEFSKLGQGDAAGAEFDDLIDAVDALVARGIVDNERVGITGGSYGGYATAWCGTRYTERFRAGVMFVGISNKVSKGMTTEIPVEDLMVHSLFEPYTRWQFSLERSPLYYVEQGRTPMLIAGGTSDSRVHPSQSLQFYRALKLIGKTPVRYVRYPGEKHGNSKAAARDDYGRRLMRWMDHFVMNGETELPPWEIDHGQAETEGDDDNES
jgi:dipeptidyl aminopeptidase/acylaminoacyl peptidase